MSVEELSLAAWLLLGVAAFVAGVSKTGMPGVALVAILIFTMVLPSRESTGIVLVLFIAGDIMALLFFRRQANWALLLRLMPVVVVGLVLGAVFLGFADDVAVRRVIALVVLLLLVLRFLGSRRRDERPATPLARRANAALFGSLSGFATMVANAAGPIMAMYFLALKLPVQTFLGTTAWFFAVVNLTKLPISIGLGLVSMQGLLLNALLLPALVAGGFAGRWFSRRVGQQTFERLVLWITFASALYLLCF